jgi:hypothetical protein
MATNFELHGSGGGTLRIRDCGLGEENLQQWVLRVLKQIAQRIEERVFVLLKEVFDIVRNLVQQRQRKKRVFFFSKRAKQILFFFFGFTFPA